MTLKILSFQEILNAYCQPPLNILVTLAYFKV